MIPTVVQQELDESGVPYEVTEGRKHYKLFVGGKLTAIFPKGKMARQEADKRPVLNIRSQVRRALKEFRND